MISLSDAQRIKNAFVSKEVWDKTKIKNKVDLMSSVIIGIDFNVVAKAGKMVLGERWSQPGWDYSYEEIIAIFDTIIRLSKLGSFI